MRETAEFLRRGARMLNQACPECGTPLFQDKSGGVFCPSCKRPVRYVEEVPETMEAAEGSLEATLNAKLSQVQSLLEAEDDPGGIRELTETVSTLLAALEKLRRMG